MGLFGACGVAPSFQQLGLLLRAVTLHKLGYRWRARRALQSRKDKPYVSVTFTKLPAENGDTSESNVGEPSFCSCAGRWQRCASGCKHVKGRVSSLLRLIKRHAPRSGQLIVPQTLSVMLETYELLALIHHCYTFAWSEQAHGG